MEPTTVSLRKTGLGSQMKAKGLPVEIIKETTGLDDAAIEKL
jgi:hypothetical protein